MSVLIKDMVMPESCYKCKLDIRTDVCLAFCEWKKEHPYSIRATDRLPDCPLSEVPESCEDAVSRADVVDMLEMYPFTEYGEYEAAREAVKRLPPAQPQRKYGQWMYGGDNKWCCSECGCVIKGSWKHPLERMNYYCKECGADMREESNGQV